MLFHQANGKAALKTSGAKGCNRMARKWGQRKREKGNLVGSCTAVGRSEGATAVQNCCSLSLMALTGMRATGTSRQRGGKMRRTFIVLSC